MTETDKYQVGVAGIISRAKAYEPETGSYEKHFYNKQFRFAVKLSNGRMEFGEE